MTEPATTPTSSPGGQLQERESVVEVTRRRFLGLLFAVATAVGLGALAAPLARFSYPVLKGQVFERIKVATVGAVTNEGVRFDYQDTPAMLILTSAQEYAAFSLVCTHLGCIVKWEARNRNFHCPCHAGKFDENGNVTAGPPPLPLPQYKVAVEGSDIFVEGIA